DEPARPPARHPACDAAPRQRSLPRGGEPLPARVVRHDRLVQALVPGVRGDDARVAGRRLPPGARRRRGPRRAAARPARPAQRRAGRARAGPCDLSRPDPGGRPDAGPVSRAAHRPLREEDTARRAGLAAPALNIPDRPSSGMPPEWAPHERTLIAWPCRRELWGDRLAQARAETAGVANA